MAESLTDAYRRCQALHRSHGRTYYLATRLLPAWKRRHVHALYGFTRYADEIVDATDGTAPAVRADRLRDWGDALRAGKRNDPLLPAVLHTIEVFGLDRADFDRFLDSMAMDLTVRRYRDYAALLEYMAGSAAAVGSMMLPILLARARSSDGDSGGGSAGTSTDGGPRAAGGSERDGGDVSRDGGDVSKASGDVGGAGGDVSGAGESGRDGEILREAARQLGLAFQLTNFIRDIAEDLRRDRVYLPLEDLDRFGVRIEDLYRCARERSATPAVRDLIAFEVDRAREHYARAAPGVVALPLASQSCVRTAYRLYGGILDEVVRAGGDVFRGRARVPVPRRLAVAAASLLTPPGRPVPLPGRPGVGGTRRR